MSPSSALPARKKCLSPAWCLFLLGCGGPEVAAITDSQINININNDESAQMPPDSLTDSLIHIQTISPPPGTIDTLEYLISDYAVGMSAHPKSNGRTQIVGSNFVYDVKSASGRYELRYWDSDNIRLAQDASVNGAWMCPTYPKLCNAYSYRLSPGTWMKRYMKPGEPTQIINQVDWYDRDCKLLDTWVNWSYYILLERILPELDIGGDLGIVKDVLVLKFDYQTSFERFYYAKKWGWIRWEEWDPKGASPRKTVAFNNLRTELWNAKPMCGAPKAAPVPAATHRGCVAGTCTWLAGPGPDSCSACK